jgi:hypothetical protein
LIIEGGVVAYESNVRTGGKGANYLGIGASTQYRIDQVTVSLRSVDVRTGQIVNAVSVTKTIYSHQFSANLYRFTSFQSLLQGETGYTRNEPAQLAVREAIEAAIIHMTAAGIRDRHFELQDPGAWDHPVIQAALLEGLAIQGRDRPEDDLPVPLAAPNVRRAPVVPIVVNGEDVVPDRPVAPRPAPATPPRPAPAANPPSAGSPGVSAPALQPVAPAPARASPQLAPAPAGASPQPVAPGPVAPSSTATRVAPAAPSVSAAPVVPAATAATAATAAPAVPPPASKSGDIFDQYWKRR